MQAALLYLPRKSKVTRKKHPKEKCIVLDWQFPGQGVPWPLPPRPEPGQPEPLPPIGVPPSPDSEPGKKPEGGE